jgi:hypothetical protein
LLLFLIASTIVLALIPVYLPSRSATLSMKHFQRKFHFLKTFSYLLDNQMYYAVADYNGTLGNDGTLDDNARANIARAVTRFF